MRRRHELSASSSSHLCSVDSAAACACLGPAQPDPQHAPLSPPAPRHLIMPCYTTIVKFNLWLSGFGTMRVMRDPRYAVRRAVRERCAYPIILYGYPAYSPRTQLKPELRHWTTHRRGAMRARGAEATRRRQHATPCTRAANSVDVWMTADVSHVLVPRRSLVSQPDSHHSECLCRFPPLRTAEPPPRPPFVPPRPLPPARPLPLVPPRPEPRPLPPARPPPPRR